MELQLSSKNEFQFYPDISNNLELPEEQRFTIVYKKINNFLHGDKWTDFDDKGQVEHINILKKLQMHIIRIDNPPKIKDDITGKTEVLTKELLLSEKYSGLDEVINQLFLEISGVKDTEDIKKS